MRLPALYSSRITAYHELYVGKRAGECGVAFWDAAKRFLRRRRQSLLDITIEACAAQFQIDQPFSELDPLLQKAITDTNPTITDHHWFELGADERMGAINTAKGKYFEYMVADRLNAGEQVGDVVLDQGQQAVLAESMTQPGWDMQIVDSKGEVVSYLQLKATESSGYIQQTLERYPDIQILSTSEVADNDYSGHIILDSGMSDAKLQEQLGHAIDVADTSITERFADYASPLLPLMAITAMESYKVALGQSSVDQFSEAIAHRGKRLLAAKLVGSTVFALGGGLLAIPAAFAGGLWFDRLQNLSTLQTAYVWRVDRLVAMAEYRHQRLLKGNE